MQGEGLAPPPLRVLIVDNDSRIRTTVGDALETHGYMVSGARTGSEALKTIDNEQPDLVLIDLLLPDVSGLELIEQMEDRLPECGFILVTGKASIDSAAQAVRSSVAAYLTKPLDVGQLLATVRRVTERRAHAAIQDRMQQDLARAKERWENTFDAIPDPIAIARQDGTLIQVNRAFATRLGLSDRKAQATDLELLFGSDTHPLGRTAKETALSGGSFLDESDELAIDGTFAYASYPLELEDGPGVIHLLRDVTEQRRTENDRRRLELQLEKIHRVESIGRLAGGVAHDFNNLLTVILGNLELAESDSLPGSGQHHYLVEARKAASRAAELTQQLVTFARHQRTGERSPTRPSLDINLLLLEVRELLQRTLGEDVELHLRPAEILWPVEAEAAQMTQVLLNLAANARDAMPDGGTLTIHTQNRRLRSQDKTILPHLRSGDYVELVVQDTGVGIVDEVRPHLFEPFFTTKEVGAGSGLGLATTYGIVTRAGGAIRVDNPPEGGAAFTILIPRSETPAAVESEAARSGPSMRGNEVILLVEDDVAVRSTVVPGLLSLGYQIIAAGSADEALERYRQYAGKVDLLVTDIVMPGLNGFELAERIRQCGHSSPVLFVSGYPYHALEGRRGYDATAAWLQKPFSPVELAAKIREVLGG